jgi:hypothetical protein
MSRLTLARLTLARLSLALVVALLAGGLVAALAGAPVARASEPAFGAPTATARIGQPVVFTTTLTGAERPERVELVLAIPGQRAVNVVVADVTGNDGQWQASVELLGHSVPNTTLEYRFRTRTADGWLEGPQDRVTVVHDRFDWRTVEGPVVRLHWYEGSDEFGRRALEIGERAVARASELLGVTESEPIDFFIYASQPDMYEALGTGTRENVGGQAHSHIRTMFGLIEPSEINSDWVDTLVAHELTHLVFDTATDNPYRSPPRWLNEGVAVYLSEGYTPAWQAAVEQAARDGSLIPLEGLGGLFPSPVDQFRLAYGVSVSAVDYFVRTYDEQSLWQLVRSYAEGLSDDEAFNAAIGQDLATFNEAWMGSLGVAVPEPHGPRPAPPGPVPPDWQEQPAGSPAPGSTPPAVPQPTEQPTAEPAVPPSGPRAADDQALLTVAGVAAAVLLLAVVAALLLRRRGIPDRSPPRAPR